MVKHKTRKKSSPKQARKNASQDSQLGGRVIKITPDTPYGQCSERLTALGGFLALVKFLDLTQFESLFEQH